MQYEFILMAIPIVIIVAFLILIAKRMTDGERPDISSAVLGTIIIAVGLLIMVPIISSVDPQYAYDEEDKTFTLYKNVTGTEFSWGSAANAENLIIEDTVTTISAGAFASFTDLKYISIPDSMENITSSAFGVTLVDLMGQSAEIPASGEYYGSRGTLYLCDPDIYTYSSDNTTITGLASSASEATHLMIPSERNGVTITTIGRDAFSENEQIEFVGFVPDSALTTFEYRAFGHCTSLASISFPATVMVFKTNSFNRCPISEVVFPDSVTTIGGTAFANNTHLTTVAFGSGIQTIAAYAFANTTSVTSVTFSGGFAATELDSSWTRWNFYDSDGTTILNRTVASDLAGFTFQGTAVALVKVLPDRSALTLEQTLKVQELTKAAEKAAKLEDAELQISDRTELAEA